MASQYDNKTKEEVVEFIRQYNQENGRGGQSAAIKKWDLNGVTVKSWLKKAGVETPGRSGKKKRGGRRRRAAKTPGEGVSKPGRKANRAAKTGGDLEKIFARMVAIRKEMGKLDAEYAALKGQL